MTSTQVASTVAEIPSPIEQLQEIINSGVPLDDAYKSWVEGSDTDKFAALTNNDWNTIAQIMNKDNNWAAARFEAWSNSHQEDEGGYPDY